MTAAATGPSGIAELAESSIPERFEDCVRRFAARRAVSSRDVAFTYEALNRAANRAAHAIIERAGTGPGPVVLVTERDPWAVVGILAVAKAGKFAVPIHPKNNEDRMLDLVLAEMGDPLVLAHGKTAEHLRDVVPSRRLMRLESPSGAADETDPGLAPGPDDLSCVIYTSGSTGTPKGVVHTHRNILHRIFWYAERFGIGAGDRSMMLSSADHISGVVGMLRPLLTGAELRVLDIRTEGFERLAEELRRERVTMLPIVNTVFRRFVDAGIEGPFPDLRLIILGGEALQPGDVERYRRTFAESCLLLNTLGCTELPTYRYLVIDKRQPIGSAPIPAGHAVPGIDVAVIGADGHPVPDGERGEILVRSRYLALGYWNRSKETAERFADLEDGERSFRTGDLGYLLKDGALVHLGRDDWMIKILGNRVEVTEVEEAIHRVPGVRDVAVTSWPDEAGEPRLYAYVVPERQPFPVAQEIRAFVRARLPDYMVPFGVVFVAELPLTRTGKTDRRALPPPRAGAREPSAARRAPRDELERKLVAVWEDVLKARPIGIDESFFDLGGESLLAVSVVARIERVLGIELSAAAPFMAPTVAAMAELLRSSPGWSEEGKGQRKDRAKPRRPQLVARPRTRR